MAYLILALPASAQVSTGSISGVVKTDPAAPQCPTLRYQQQMPPTESVGAKETTDKLGYFKLALLPIGRYNVEVAK